MRILAVGGGSGGHVVPVVAVFKEILRRNSQVELRFWCDKKFFPQASKIMLGEFSGTVKVSHLPSGKLRRYHHLTFWQHLTIPNIVFRNLADVFKNIAGVFVAFFKLIFWRPDVIFCKGGFVCVPVGVAAWVLRIPLVIHDSDAHPGLANRILSRFARRIATGAPLEFYRYPKAISRYVGIPVLPEFKKYSLKQRTEFKKSLGFSPELPVVLVTGGGLGAERLNNAVFAEREKLAAKAQILLVSGAGQFDELTGRGNLPANFQIKGFIAKDMWKYLAAADLVVARAGATSNLELASLAKPTILVPNGRLTGGHQLKNAQVYQKSGAVKIASDDEIEQNPEILSDAVLELLANPKEMNQLGARFFEFAKPNAAKEVCDLIFEVVNL